MAFISTALSALGKLANVGLTGLSAYSLFKGTQTPRIPAYSGGPVAFPGGASMGSFALPLLGAGAGALGAAQMAGFGPFTPGSPYGGIGEPGGYFGGETQINPVPVRGGYRLPHQVMVPHPSMPGNYVTYVRAPAVRYRVTVRSYKRRHCSGGR